MNPLKRECLVVLRTTKIRSAALLKVRALLGQDGAFHRAHLQTDAAVDAGVEIDPVKVGALFVFSLTLIDAGHGAGIHTVGNALADIGDDRVGHNSAVSTLILRIDPIELEATLVCGLLFSQAPSAERMQFNHRTSALLMPPTLTLQCRLEG